jgi:hypothetical protein
MNKKELKKISRMEVRKFRIARRYNLTESQINTALVLKGVSHLNIFSCIRVIKNSPEYIIPDYIFDDLEGHGMRKLSDQMQS